MQASRSHFVLAATAIALTFGVTACGSTLAGSATPSQEGLNWVKQRPQREHAWLQQATQKPCDLLTNTQARQLGFTLQGKPSSFHSGSSSVHHTGCVWKSSQGEVFIVPRPDDGLDSTTSNDRHILGQTFDRHSYSDQCQYNLGIGQSTRIDIGGIHDDGPDCTLAENAAKFVIANMPL